MSCYNTAISEVMGDKLLLIVLFQVFYWAHLSIPDHYIVFNDNGNGPVFIMIYLWNHPLSFRLYITPVRQMSPNDQMYFFLKERTIMWHRDNHCSLHSVSYAHLYGAYQLFGKFLGEFVDSANVVWLRGEIHFRMGIIFHYLRYYYLLIAPQAW